ncbi:DMT family transporter [Streptomyces olivoreticuli]|uniref:DMT family transporter n=1 Tax=Streptomyces blastmyceticus TaxID=68180 RepID=A0ABN0XUA2_9ACTN|nr:DMT family transporter [Streptomyces olivoreticuli]WKK27058.1 DMT family transporter [Streptomyces olivoreticuli]
MLGRSKHWLLGIAGGVLLALMTNYNSLLAKHTSSVFGSWVAHGIGAVAALLLVLVTARAFGAGGGERKEKRAKAPFWVYLGGIPGAFTVMLAAIAVNSSLELSGTIALMLVGQVLFGIVSDYFGLFGTPRRRLVLADFFVVLSVLTGSALIIFGGA